MKKLYSFGIACFIAITSFAQPCSVSHPSITVRNVDAVTGQVTFDLTFTADFNSGSKSAVVHLWENDGSYPASISYPASAAATSQAIGTLVVKDPGTGNPVYQPSYAASGLSGGLSSPYLVPTQFLYSGANSTRTFTFKGLVATISNPAVATSIRGDVYATQNNNNTNGGCVSRGSIQVVINEPGMRGVMTCSSPRSFTVSFSTSVATSITFEAYKDVAPFGIFDATDRQAANQLTLTDGSGTSTSKTINNPAQPTNQYTTYGPYSFAPQPAGSQFGLWVVARAGSNTYDNILLVENTCSLLPVSFTSFTAKRNKQNVVLQWETAFEQNNAGFTVQRKTTAGWEEVAAVASKAINGNSATALNYQVTDVNSLKGVSQYRIRQTDMDGKESYTGIRIVQGEGAVPKLLVYPNPTSTGIFTVSFDNASDRYSVQLMDAMGRVIKNWNDVSNNLQIADLKAGQYLLRVKNLSTEMTSTTQVMVTK